MGSSDRLSDLHEVAKNSLRQKILLKLGQHNSQDFDGLSKNLKITDTFELSKQLNILQEITVEGERIIAKQENSYALTEKGHEVLNKIIAFPELASNCYGEKLLGESSQPKQSKPRPKWFTPYWIAIVVLTIVIGLVLILLRNTSVETGIIFLFVILVAEGIAYYIRVKPSLRLNRIMYILIGVPLGFVIWIAFWLLIMRQVYPQGAESWSIVIASIIGCYTVAFIIGDMIGRLRHYKGPQQYSP